jgi:hypothetical protein
LERASSGLVYSSESDRPFEFFSVPFAGIGGPPATEDFRALLGIDADTRIEVRSLADFFARHTDTSDPYDQRAQQIRPRYEALVALLRKRLRAVQVYRVGRIQVHCYVVGDDGRGNLAGLHTVAVET